MINIFANMLNFNKEQKGKKRPSDLLCVAKVSNHSHRKILTPKQTLQISLIALVQLEAGKIFENLLNEIKKMVYMFFVPSKRYY